MVLYTILTEDDLKPGASILEDGQVRVVEDVSRGVVTFLDGTEKKARELLSSGLHVMVVPGYPDFSTFNSKYES